MKPEWSVSLQGAHALLQRIINDFEATMALTFKACGWHSTHRTLIAAQDYLRLNYFRMNALQHDDATKLSATLKILLEAEVC
jgi:hypothetical protein